MFTGIPVLGNGFIIITTETRKLQGLWHSCQHGSHTSERHPVEL